MSEEKTVPVEMTKRQLEVMIELAFSVGFDELSEKFEDALAKIRGME